MQTPLIDIRRRIFREDPAVRFERMFKKPGSYWREVWRRYKILDYTEEEAREYLMLLTKTKISPLNFRRWIRRTEVYNRAQLVVKSGAYQVNPKYFGELQSFVERELSKNNHA